MKRPCLSVTVKTRSTSLTSLWIVYWSWPFLSSVWTWPCWPAGAVCAGWFLSGAGDFACADCATAPVESEIASKDAPQRRRKLETPKSIVAAIILHGGLPAAARGDFPNDIVGQI